jgi:STE24 endopeptidase
MMQAGGRLKLLFAVLVLFVLLPRCPPAPASEFKVSAHFSHEEIETAARFNSKLYHLFVFKGIVLLAFLGLVAFSRLRTAYGRDVEKVCFGRRWLVLPVYAFSVVLMIRLVLLPFDAVRDLIIKKSVGLTVQGPGGWLADQVKGFFVGDIWYVPFVVLLYALMRRFRRTWWLISAATVGVMTVAWYSLAPYLVEPLFYRITPLRSESLHERLDPLLQEAGLDPGALYEAHSGQKTREVNAYASGLFLGRRIVLYDVLAEEADPEELEFVVAHEIAHWKKDHVIKGIALGTAGAAGVFLLLGVLLKLTPGKRNQEGFHTSESLPIFFFWLNVILILTMPLGCAISRHFERTADSYAVKLTQNPGAAALLFQKVARKNLSDLNPPPLARLWLFTHPPITERIEAALQAGAQVDSGILVPPPSPKEPAPTQKSNKLGSEGETRPENKTSEKGEKTGAETD